MYGLVTLVACGSHEPPDLVLEGPDHLRVDRLGPVDGPRVLLDDGSEPDGVIWSLSRDGVAHVDGDRVVAEGPGEVQVVAEWEEQRVEWTLRVELATRLAFVHPPSTVRVGEEVTLLVDARTPNHPVAVGPIEWTSSNTEILTVNAGPPPYAYGLSVGTAYVTASVPGASAMIELEVVP